MQRWLSFHFYNASQQSDYYYLKLCNEIYNRLRDDDFPDEEIAISDEQKKNLACFITSYLYMLHCCTSNRVGEVSKIPSPPTR